MADGVLINGVDYVQYQNLVISDILTKEINTASFDIIDTYANKPNEGETVYIEKDAVALFSGRITSITAEKLSGNNFIFSIECSDWQIDLDKKLVIENYNDMNSYDIIVDILTKYTTGFTYTNVANPGVLIHAIQFNYRNVSEALSDIAEMIGYDWYIDYTKDLHFFDQTVYTTPINLVDDATNFDDLIITPDTSQLANRIYVSGGYTLSSEYTQDPITAVAGQTEFGIRYFPHNFSVEVDSVVKTVGIENIDTPGSNDFLINFNEKLLKCDTITMSGGEVIEMTYLYEVPILERVDDIASQAAIAAIEGGDGVYEKRIDNPEIETITQAQDIGNAELLKYSNPLVEGSFKTYVAGFKSGQLLHIQLTDRNINEDYLVREVVAESIGGDTFVYTITFATQLQGFNWLMIKILDALKPKEKSTFDIIGQLVLIDTDTVTATETSVTPTEKTTAYRYDDADALYNAAEYG